MAKKTTPKKQVKKSTPNVVQTVLSVVGMTHYTSIQDRSQIAQILDGEGGLTCTLERERDNEVDSYAIKVIGLDAERKRFNGVHIGYVQRPSNRPLAHLLSRGARVKSCVLTYIEVDDGKGEAEVVIQRPKE